MLLQDHDQSTIIQQALVTMQRDRKYFVVADEEGYISAIGKLGAKQKPFRTYVGNPKIL